MFNLGLKEAKDMVEKTPCVLKSACKKAEAEELKTKLTALGCTINLIWNISINLCLFLSGLLCSI